LAIPELTLTIGGLDATMRPGQYERHGVIGMNVLNSARKVTLDLRAMRLTLE
jgi:hypothetical protein